MIRKMLAVAVIVGTPLPFHAAKAETLKQSVKCLADNIYFEARDDGPAGWSAVGHVTLNRWRHLRLQRPNVGICTIVYAGSQRGHHRCQFSWACDGKPKHKTEKEVAEQITRLAWQLIEEKRAVADPTRGAMYFHEKRVRPRWAKDGSTKRTVAIGRHYYYKPTRPTEMAEAPAAPTPCAGPIDRLLFNNFGVSLSGVTTSCE
ncbi:MAG: cell wall hydrolase [Rhodospirillaceae bacterium]